MVQSDIIDDWSATTRTGVFTYDNNVTVGYSYYSSGGMRSVSDLDGSAELRGPAERVGITFDEPITNVLVKIGDHHDVERLVFNVDGVDVNFQTLVASGDVTITGTEGTSGVAALNASGQISNASSWHELLSVTFNIPIQELVIRDVSGAAYSTEFDIFLDDNSIYAPPCFTTGTMIDTVNGPTKVEDLKVGDKIRTMDYVHQPIRWIGHSRVYATGFNTPIRPHQGRHIGQHR